MKRLLLHTLVAVLLVGSCSRGSEKSKWDAFDFPALPVPPAVSEPSVPRPQRRFDAEHKDKIRTILASLEEVAAHPSLPCNKGAELRTALLMKMAALDPLMEESWALRKLRRALDLLTIAHTALGCRPQGERSAPLRHARLILSEVEHYLDTL